MKVQLTGNIFFDAGYYLFYYILNKSYDDKEFSREEIEKVIEWLLGESKTWLKNQRNKFSPYFLNNPISDPKIKSKEERVKRLSEKLYGFLNQWKEIESKPCFICGQYECIDKGLTRVELPLSGSLQARNFYPGWVEGLQVCGICAIKSYAGIFATVNSSGKIILLNSNISELMQIWIQKICRQTEREQAKGYITEKYGPVTVNIANPFNAVYFLLYDLNKYSDKLKFNSGIEFLYYTNFAAGPEIKIFPITSKIISFLLILRSKLYLTQWNHFVYQFYTSNKVKYDNEQKLLIVSEKNETRNAEEEDYRNNRNRVIQHLLTDRRLGLFEFTRERKLRIDFQIIQIYYQEVVKVDKDKIEKLKQTTELIADEIKNGNMKLYDLEKVSSYGDFLIYLRRAARKFVNNNGKALFSLDDFLNYYTSKEWRTDHTIMLIYIYELLADFIKEKLNKEEEEKNATYSSGADTH